MLFLNTNVSRHEWSFKTATLYGFGILTTLGRFPLHSLLDQLLLTPSFYFSLFAFPSNHFCSHLSNCFLFRNFPVLIFYFSCLSFTSPSSFSAYSTIFTSFFVKKFCLYVLNQSLNNVENFSQIEPPWQIERKYFNSVSSLFWLLRPVWFSI